MTDGRGNKNMVNPLKKSAQKVQDLLLEKGFENQVVELPSSTRTAQEAADAIGCNIAQIGKSIVFRFVDSGRPLLVVASGVNRIDDKRLGGELGEKLGKADANFVRESTGFAIGGVPPIGHANPVQVIIDEDLFKYDEIWVAAGHAMAVFPLTPDELVNLTAGEVMTVK